MIEENSPNGKTDGRGVGPTPAFALRVFSVTPGIAVIARFLAYSEMGLFTHYVRSRSHYCPGRVCECQYKNKYTRTWKGYAPVILWNAARKVWSPNCLEITESLELDFRNVAARGQEWELFRNTFGSSKKAEPVQGRYLEEVDDKKLPKAFNFMPCLQTLYHSLEVRLEWPNPLPPRVFLQEIEGDAPSILSKPEAVVPPEQQDFSPEAFERAKQAARQKKSPIAEKAARGY